MTTYSAVLAGYQNEKTTASLKALMTSIDTLMTNAGWAQAADTGQLDINSVTYAATGTYGYKIWYLNDSLHSTYPIYIRLYWRMQTTDTPGLAFTIGHATDGAGNITGFKQGSDTTYLFQGTAWGTAGNSSRACSLNGYSYFVLCPTAHASTTTPPWLMVSREWDPDTGAVTGGNYSILYRNNSYVVQNQLSITRADSLAHSTGNTGKLGFVPADHNQSLRGSYLDVYKTYQIYLNHGYRVNGGLCLYQASEITQFTTFSAQILTGGTSRTWLATGMAGVGGQSDVTHLAAVLWE